MTIEGCRLGPTRLRTHGPYATLSDLYIRHPGGTGTVLFRNFEDAGVGAEMIVGRCAMSVTASRRAEASETDSSRMLCRARGWAFPDA